MIITIMIMIVIDRVAMLIDRDTAIVCAAYFSAYGRCIATRTDYRNRSHLWDEDAVEQRIGCHRMRARRLRNLLDQELSLGIDDAQDRSAEVLARSEIVAAITAIEIHFIGARNSGNRRLFLGLGVDDESDLVAGIILRRASQDDVIVWANACSVGSTARQGTTPVFVPGLNAPRTAVGAMSVFGLMTNRPPLHVIGPELCP